METKLILFDLNGTLIYRENHEVIIRPLLDKFPINDNIIYGIYSSMLNKNIINILPLLPIKISVIYDRKYNDIDTTIKFGTKRNINKILNHYFIKKNKIKKENIIIIDNEERKVIDCKENAIIISTFTGNNDDIELNKIISLIKLLFQFQD
jgi:hypothetical protein